jgi:hypothetical protein
MGAYGSPELFPKSPQNDTNVYENPHVSYKQHFGILWSFILRVFLWVIIIALMIFLSVVVFDGYFALFL